MPKSEKFEKHSKLETLLILSILESVFYFLAHGVSWLALKSDLKLWVFCSFV